MHKKRIMDFIRFCALTADVACCGSDVCTDLKLDSVHVRHFLFGQRRIRG